MTMHGTLATDAGEASSSRLSNVSELGQRALLFFQPWRRRALLLIALIAAFCNFYQLQANGYANLYYAAAIRSMMQNWHNFFFVSFDPGGFVSVDKPPLGFWIQTISAKTSATAASASCCRRRWPAWPRWSCSTSSCGASLARARGCWPRWCSRSRRSASSRTATTRLTACSC